jgi:hypothetical protein
MRAPSSPDVYAAASIPITSSEAPPKPLRVGRCDAVDEPTLSKLLLDGASRPPSGGSQEQPENSACHDELNVCAEAAGAMPAAPVEELLAARTQPRDDVLEVGCGGGAGPERGWIERPPTKGEQHQCEQPASNLKRTLGEVLVRNSITGKMQRRPKGERGCPRSCQRTEQRTGRDMKRDDHSPFSASWGELSFSLLIIPGLLFRRCLALRGSSRRRGSTRKFAAFSRCLFAQRGGRSQRGLRCVGLGRQVRLQQIRDKAVALVEVCLLVPREDEDARPPRRRVSEGRRSAQLRRPLATIYGTKDAKMSVRFELETVCV